jgi:hypothetical protein
MSIWHGPNMLARPKQRGPGKLSRPNQRGSDMCFTYFPKHGWSTSCLWTWKSAKSTWHESGMLTRPKECGSDKLVRPNQRGLGMLARPSNVDLACLLGLNNVCLANLCLTQVMWIWHAYQTKAMFFSLAHS